MKEKSFLFNVQQFMQMAEIIVDFHKRLGDRVDRIQ